MGSYKSAVRQLRYAGQEVAAVCAEDPYVAEEALEAIKIAYSQLIVNKVQDAMAEQPSSGLARDPEPADA